MGCRGFLSLANRIWGIEHRNLLCASQEAGFITEVSLANLCVKARVNTRGWIRTKSFQLQGSLQILKHVIAAEEKVTTESSALPSWVPRVGDKDKENESRGPHELP